MFIHQESFKYDRAVPDIDAITFFTFTFFSLLIQIRFISIEFSRSVLKHFEIGLFALGLRLTFDCGIE